MRNRVLLAVICTAIAGLAQTASVPLRRQLDPQHTALVLCDMWDHHWCQGAENRVGILAAKMAPVIDQLRAHGVLIIHAPSETMEFYKDNPERLAMLKIPQVEPPHELNLTEPPLPIDDSDGGCDTPNNPLKPNTRVWTRENSAIRIVPGDLVSDKGQEVYSALCQRGIHDLLIAGVHTNMCVLNRGFAIKQMSKWGVHCILIRDLTDAMYNPKRAPFVTHAQGTELVIEHIERYWAPTTTSTELLNSMK
jgi:nicotinamidase-related amidase